MAAASISKQSLVSPHAGVLSLGWCALCCVALCGRALWITAFDLNEIDPEKVTAAKAHTV